MKKCSNCNDAIISEEGIYCERLGKWVGRCDEQKCVISKAESRNTDSIKSNN